MKGLRFGTKTVGSLAFAATLLWGLIGGGTVAAQTERPSPNDVISLSVAPNDAARVVVGTLNSPDPGGIYYSENGGVTWTQAEGTPLDVSISALEHDALNPAIVYAGDAATGHFLRSTDGGRTFEVVDSLQIWLSEGSVIGALYSHVNVGGFAVLHAGTRLDGVLHSTTNGASWALNAIGLPRPDDIAQSARRVRALLMHEEDLYIGTHNGVYMQPAGSDAWQRAEGMPEGAIVRALGAYRNNLYAGLVGRGVWRAVGGTRWEPVPGLSSASSVFSLDPVGSLFAAGTGLGPWAGNGDDWLKSKVDSQTRDVHVWTADSWTAEDSQGGILYLGTADEWVLRSDDQGYSFQSFGSFPPLEPRPLPPIATAPTETPVVVQPEAETAPEAAPTATAVAPPLPSDETPEPARNAYAAAFYDNIDLAGAPVARRVDAAPLKHQWGYELAAPELGGDNFSARFDGLFDFEAALYRFNVVSDDGVRLYIDDQLVLDQWQEQDTSFAPEVELAAGTHRVILEYFELEGLARIELSWEKVVADEAGSTSATEPELPEATATPSAFSLFGDTITLFGLTIGSIDLPWIGPVSPAVFAGGCLLILLILLSVISVFRNSGDEE